MYIQEGGFNKGTQNNTKREKDNLSNKWKKKSGIHMQKSKTAQGKWLHD